MSHSQRDHHDGGDRGSSDPLRQDRRLWELLGRGAPPVPEPAPDFTARTLRQLVAGAVPPAHRRGLLLPLAVGIGALAAAVLITVTVMFPGPSSGDADPVTVSFSWTEAEDLLEDGLPVAEVQQLAQEVLQELPEEDRVVVALLHVAEDLPVLEDLEALEIGSTEVGLLATELAVELEEDR
jgi:hypothetical protein